MAKCTCCSEQHGEQHSQAQLMFLTALTCTSTHAHAAGSRRWKTNTHHVQITARDRRRHHGEESNQRGQQNKGNQRPFLPQHVCHQSKISNHASSLLKHTHKKSKMLKHSCFAHFRHPPSHLMMLKHPDVMSAFLSY